MDALDRLLRRLVQNISTSYPEYLTRPFEVAELYQVLVPYRLNRRELELETNQDYEVAVMQLLAGERGYLVGDPEMQMALGNELASPNPDTGAFRRYASAQVSLSPEILRRLETRRGEPAATVPPSAAPREVTVPAREMPPEGIKLGTFGATLPASDHAPATPRPPEPAGEPPGAAPGGTAGAEGPRILRPFTVADAPRAESAGAQGGSAPPQSPPSRPTSGAGAPPSRQEEMMANSRPAKTIMGGGPCPYCGGALPEGRRITFCPHCGHNLTIQYCPACSTELETDWKFCTTCGREQVAAR